MDTNEQNTAGAFSKQSVVFDTIYGSNTIIRYKRKRVREHINLILPPQSKILELNAGTGEDAIYFAKQAHQVHATDISSGMLQVMKQKIEIEKLGAFITTEQCSFTALESLQHRGPYNFIFSNFAGLNCTQELPKVLNSFASLLAPNGLITLVLLPPFCLWETLLIFKGKFKTAFRRMNSKNGTNASVEGVPFKCWYYKPALITEVLKDEYDLIALEGLCTLVPPSYIENFPEKHPWIYNTLVTMENRMKGSWPWKYIGDYYIITLRRK